MGIHVANCFGQKFMQISPVQVEIRSAKCLLMRLTQGNSVHQFGCIKTSVLKGLWANCKNIQFILETQVVEDLDRVGATLNASADLSQDTGLLVDSHKEALFEQLCSGCEAPNASTHHNDPQILFFHIEHPVSRFILMASRRP